MSKKLKIDIQRVYDVLDTKPESGDYRVLVDRLWPRGVKKTRVHHDEWDKEITPSTDLREAFHEGDMNFHNFSEAYRAELRRSDEPQALLQRAREAEAEQVVLLYASKDLDHNHAVVLQEVLEDLQ